MKRHIQSSHGDGDRGVCCLGICRGDRGSRIPWTSVTKYKESHPSSGRSGNGGSGNGYGGGVCGGDGGGGCGGYSSDGRGGGGGEGGGSGGGCGCPKESVL